ncbi:MAG: hypothetical protein AABZ80_00690 [Gemmatimonadota bacterium]
MTNRIYVGLALVAGSLVAAPAGAQGGVSDSLAVRLRRAEAAIEVLQKQLSEQADQGVKSRSRVDVEIFGRVLMNGFANSRRVNNVDNPQFVRPDTIAGFPSRGAGMAIRHTRLGLLMRVPEVWGGSFTGDIEADFSGGQQPSSGGRTFPLLRLRTARGVIRWSNAELLVGQESPLVSGLNPVSPTAVGTPLFAASGNLWLWLPQVRFGVEAGGRFRVGFQAAVLAPTSGDAAGVFDTDNDLAERSSRPYLQDRVYARWGTELVREVGCGYHIGWLAPTTTSALVQSDAITCDASLPVVEWLELRGEVFSGDAVRGLGGGGIGQNLTAANAAIPTQGGWAQINLRPTSTWRLGGGCGTDQPDQVGARRRNDSCAGYAIVRPGGPMFLGVEYRRIRTSYAVTRFSNDHVTFAVGFEF